MTVLPIVPSITYIGNGATTEFSFLFQVVEASDVVVVLINRSTLQKTLLVQDVDYSITLTDGFVQSVVDYPLVGSPMASTHALEIRRQAPMEQETSYSTQGNFSPTTLEDALDYITMLVQQNSELLSGGTGVLRMRSVALADLPSALTAAPALLYVRDAAGGGIPCFSDGTNWRRVDNREIVA